MIPTTIYEFARDTTGPTAIPVNKWVTDLAVLPAIDSYMQVNTPNGKRTVMVAEVYHIVFAQDEDGTRWPAVTFPTNRCVIFARTSHLQHHYLFD